MLCLLRSLTRKAWGLACILSLAPLAGKATEHDLGRLHTSHWTWVEAAGPPAAMLFIEVALQYACSRIRAGPTKERHTAAV